MAPLPTALLIVPPLAFYGADTVASFRKAALTRLAEGALLLPANYNDGAVYLCGYAVEASLTAAWFRWMGHGPNQPITAHDWGAARGLAASYGLSLGNLHNLAAWVRWLVVCRALTIPYLAGFQHTLLGNVDLVHQFWAPDMRYQAPAISAPDATAVHTAAAWVVGQYPNL